MGSLAPSPRKSLELDEEETDSDDDVREAYRYEKKVSFMQVIFCLETSCESTVFLVDNRQ